MRNEKADQEGRPQTSSRNPCIRGSGIWDIGAFCRGLALATLVPLFTGCAQSAATTNPHFSSAIEQVQHASADIRVRLVGVLRTGDQGTLVKDPGWHEYMFSIENMGTLALKVHNVKLRNRDGRYFDSASAYGQIIEAPDTATEIAGTVTARAAGVAAGQAIPYGGTIVGILSTALSTSAAEEAANARREFEQRKLKDVELAPAGKMTGSAFMPRVPNPKTLVLDYNHGKRNVERIEIPLP